MLVCAGVLWRPASGFGSQVAATGRRPASRPPPAPHSGRRGGQRLVLRLVLFGGLMDRRKRRAGFADERRDQVLPTEGDKDRSVDVIMDFLRAEISPPDARRARHPSGAAPRSRSPVRVAVPGVVEAGHGQERVLAAAPAEGVEPFAETPKALPLAKSGSFGLMPVDRQREREGIEGQALRETGSLPTPIQPPGRLQSGSARTQRPDVTWATDATFLL